MDKPSKRPNIHAGIAVYEVKDLPLKRAKILCILIESSVKVGQNQCLIEFHVVIELSMCVVDGLLWVLILSNLVTILLHLVTSSVRVLGFLFNMIHTYIHTYIHTCTHTHTHTLYNKHYNMPSNR